jgi:hypothetical protein
MPLTTLIYLPIFRPEFTKARLLKGKHAKSPVYRAHSGPMTAGLPTKGGRFFFLPLLT